MFESKRIQLEPATLSLFEDYEIAHHEHCLHCQISSELIDNVKMIATHNGKFHSDEATATCLLRFLPEYKDYSILRTRDKNLIDQCEIVVDVGDIYDDKLKRYDHHQKGFKETFDENHKTTLSSAGLIYKHYGKRIIKELIPSLNTKDIDYIYAKLYNNLIESIDGIDNGILMCNGERNYIINTDLSNRVNSYNPSWQEESSAALENNQFKKAMAIAGSEFLSQLHFYSDSLLPARFIVENALNDAKNIHPSQAIICIRQRCPYKSHLYDIEKELKCEGRTLYALCQDNENWRVIAINKSNDSFDLRQPLCPEWSALRDHELEEKSGIQGAYFVHRNLFIGGAHTYEGALQMAIKSLEYTSKQ